MFNGQYGPPVPPEIAQSNLLAQFFGGLDEANKKKLQGDATLMGLGMVQNNLENLQKKKLAGQMGFAEMLQNMPVSASGFQSNLGG